MSVLHSPVVMPLVVGCLDEARVSEPGPGTDTRTLPPHVPVKKYLWGGFITPYAKSIGSSVIEQISFLIFGSKSFYGKILSYIFGGCMLGLTSAKLVIESRVTFSRVVCNQTTMGIYMS